MTVIPSNALFGIIQIFLILKFAGSEKNRRLPCIIAFNEKTNYIIFINRESNHCFHHLLETMVSSTEETGVAGIFPKQIDMFTPFSSPSRFVVPYEN